MLVPPDAIQLGSEQGKLFSCGPFGEDLKDSLGYDVLARVMLIFTVKISVILITLAFNQTRFIVCITKYKYNSTLRTEMQKEVNQLFIGRQYYKQKSI